MNGCPTTNEEEWAMNCPTTNEEEWAINCPTTNRITFKRNIEPLIVKDYDEHCSYI